MKAIQIDEELKSGIIDVLKKVNLFKSLNQVNLETILQYSELLEFEDGETVMQRGAASDSFILILDGEVTVYAERNSEDRKLLTTLTQGSTVGEIGVLLKKEASLTAVTKGVVRGLKFKGTLFFNMFKQVPNFGLAVAHSLAERLEEVSGQVALPQFKEEKQEKQEKRKFVRRVTDLLPVPFLQRHRVLPVRQNQNELTVGFVNEPTTGVLDSIYQLLPGMDIKPVQINVEYFDAVMRTRVGANPEPTDRIGSNLLESPRLGPKLNDLLERMVAEGASDLHLTERVRPRWRIDGDLHLIEDGVLLEPGELRSLFDPALETRHRKELDEMRDTDFGYGLRDLARFRVNMFYDAMGASVSIRQIPSHILEIDALLYTDTFKEFCSLVNGLVLVTGPTGSGKTTTLASMIDYINQTYSRHIITLEDPIEYTFRNVRSVINQREVGGHTPSFQRGLKASMREDPDVILVGEITDLETMNLVLETASTGHLVFSTLHTNSAVATVDRIIDMYPPVQQDNIRSSVSEILKGVVCQTLCKQTSGGRTAAFEILKITRAVSNLIRDGKTVQIPSIMQTAKRDGHVQLNDTLIKLIAEGRVTTDEAMVHAFDPNDLTSRLKSSQKPRTPGTGPYR